MSTESIEISDLNFKLGDIIQIESTKPDYHLKHFFIEYIDDEVIKIININDGKKDSLDLDEDGCLTDTTIHKIYLLSRSNEEGYAKQNGLLPEKYIKIVFADDVEITGKIASLEEDMIEIEVGDDEILFLDFEYKGIPKNIPIKTVVIVEKPTIQEAIFMKAEKKEKKEKALSNGDSANDDSANDDSNGNKASDKASAKASVKASIEYSPEGDIIVKIPENASVDSVSTTDDFMVGKQIEFFADVEVRESEQRYGIEIQTTDLLDELLSTIPDNARSFSVMERIHRIIRRFIELREKFSSFDKNGNILGFKNFNATYKPLVEHMNNLDTNLQWIIPVVKDKVKLYSEKVTSDEKSSLKEDLQEYKNNMEVYKGNNNYSSFYNGINGIFTPFEKFKGQDVLKSDTVKTDLEAIVDNLEDFYTQVYKKGDQIQNKRFLIQRYNLGMTKIGNKALRSGKSVYMREPIGNNDSISIKSVIMLPKPVLEFSRVNLPGTNILTRASLSQNWLYQYKLLTEKTIFSKMDIDKEYNEIDYAGEDSFLETGLSFHIPNADYPDYNTVLDSIIPRSASIIRLLKSQYIGYNFYDMLAFFEPFMMYADNITYAGSSKGSKHDNPYQGKGGPYQELRTHVIKNIKEYEKQYFEKGKKYGSLAKIKSANQKKNAIFEHIKLEMQNQIIKEYGIKHENATATEVLNKLIELDNGNFYMSLCSLIMSHLYAPELAELLDSSEYGKDAFTKSKNCSSQIIVKKYTSLPSLQKDNGKEEVYFDKDFDKTPYSILKKYEESQKKMSSEQFLEYFTTVLENEHKIQSAETVAKTIIRGKKLVEDGNYAVLIIYPTLKSSFSENSLSAEEKESVDLEADVKKRVSYFKRKGDNWVLDKEMDNSEMTNEFFCNSENSCFYDKSNEICDMAENASKRMKKIAKKSLFETAVALTLEEFRKELNKMYELKERQIKKTRLMKEARAEEFSVRAYHLGNKVKHVDIVVSPYAELRDQILGQADFVQKQENFMLFAKEHCRSAIEEESTFWLYCKETNTKLLPTFLITLASGFPMGLYEDILARMIAERGKLSDDGDAIVDKHSGYVIRYLDFVAQDEFDDQGFVVKTHDVMKKNDDSEEEINAIIEGNQQKSDKPKKRTFEDQTNLYIYNVSSAISKSLGIDIDEIDDQVLSIASRIITNKVRSKEDFDKQMEKKVKKGEKAVSYDYYKNTEIFVITATLTFIVIQTRMPSFQPKKTYPGCVYSLSGYPLENSSSNNSGLNYLSCILEKMKSTASEPWKSVSKWKSDKWIVNLTDCIDKKMLEDPVIKKMLDLKRNYLILNPDNDLIPDVHSVEKWKLFQPPLLPSNIEKKVSGVSSPFANEIKESLKTGHKDQHQHIGNLYKKMVEHTYSAVDDINKIVLRVGKDAMLKAGNVIFLENSCCDESKVEKTITYFSEKDENIRKSIEFVQKYGQIYGEIKSLSIPAFARSHLKKTEYVSADSGNFSDENIYRTYIHYCKLKTDLPVPDDLRDICLEKIAGLDTMSLEQSIQVLNDNGRNQSKETMANLMVKVSRRNRVKISFADEDVPLFDDLLIEDKVFENIQTALGSKETRSLQVFLNNLNKRMQEDIFEYLHRYGNLKKQQINKNERNEKVYTGSIVDFIENVAVWSEPKKIPSFIKNTIHYITNVIPSILQNGGMKNKEFTKNHWDFAPKHYENLTKFVGDYFKDVQSYNDENVSSLFQDIGRDIDLKDIELLVSQLVTIAPEFDHEIMMKIYKYCYLSIFSKIISKSDETEMDLIPMEQQTTDEGVEIEIADNKQFFFQQVSKLLVTILDTDMLNKGSTNFNYSDLAGKYHKESLAEKKKMTDRLKGMTKSDRDVENLLKKYKMGEWFTDDSVYKYDKAKYGKEVGEGKENDDDRPTPVFLGGEDEGVNEGFVLEEGDEDRNNNDDA